MPRTHAPINNCWRLSFLFLTLLFTGCAGGRTQVEDRSGYVEVTNPSYTLNPNASPTMWVPREYVEKGVPRGGELVKRGLESIKGTAATTSAPAASAAVPGFGERGERRVPHFEQVVAIEGDRVYFNLGAEGSYLYGQELRVFKGKTVKEGLGPVPGDVIGTIEIRGYVGSKSGFGVLKRGGPLSATDLVEVE